MGVIFDNVDYGIRNTPLLVSHNSWSLLFRVSHKPHHVGHKQIYKTREEEAGCVDSIYAVNGQFREVVGQEYKDCVSCYYHNVRSGDKQIKFDFLVH